ncbi:hypothetical protein DSO57_1011858 [Entomophthora muscae]|uniref:Uncharacterized protein n=1 Tax=Entomophthora muscae TaxID=34485 RepID=A0ACC2S867_9FUNG|nr:hypothetical protein DSO57_1011858 [Entomophthora muscae]
MILAQSSDLLGGIVQSNSSVYLGYPSNPGQHPPSSTWVEEAGQQLFKSSQLCHQPVNTAICGSGLS